MEPAGSSLRGLTKKSGRGARLGVAAKKRKPFVSGHVSHFEFLGFVSLLKDDLLSSLLFPKHSVIFNWSHNYLGESHVCNRRHVGDDLRSPLTSINEWRNNKGEKRGAAQRLCATAEACPKISFHSQSLLFVPCNRMKSPPSVRRKINWELLMNARRDVLPPDKRNIEIISE